MLNARSVWHRQRHNGDFIIESIVARDVIHHMPALTDRKAPSPAQAPFTWLVEKAFAPLAALHPAVRKVVPRRLAALSREIDLRAGNARRM